MEIALNRDSGVSIRDQLVTQLELRILDGSLGPGQRLPSVRALARRLKVHANTVSAAYQDLESAGHVRLQRGSGVFVNAAGATLPQDARGLDDLIRLTLHLAMRKGFGAVEIRTAVERWLAAAPPDRIVVVDPVSDMAAVLVHELKQRLRKPVVFLLSRGPEEGPGAARRRARPGVALLPPEPARAFARRGRRGPAPRASPEDRKALLAVPAGSIVLAVASSASLLPFANVVFKSMRGDEILLETCLVKDVRAWHRLASAADVVIADVLAAAAVRRVAPRKLREVQIVPEATLGRLRHALEFVTPR